MEVAGRSVNDNIHYAELIRGLTAFGKSTSQTHENCLQLAKPRFEFMKENNTCYSFRYDEWADIDHDRLCLTEYENSRPPVDLGTRHSAPPNLDEGQRVPVTGHRVTTLHEHAVHVSWVPNVSSRPPLRSGQDVSEALSAKTRRRIINAGTWLTAKYIGCSFLTLTYDRPLCDMEAKRHIDVFIKRLRRSKYSPEAYIWVAERTKNHLIHFHVITSNYVCKEWLQNAWRGATGLVLYTNVKKAHKYSAPYIVKYMSKTDRAVIVGRRWGCSPSVSQGCRVLGSSVEPMTWDEFCMQYEEVCPDVKREYTRSGFKTPLPVVRTPKKYIK